MTTSYPTMIFLLPFVAALLCVLVGHLRRGLAWGLTAGSLAAALALTVRAGQQVLLQGALHVNMGGWLAPLGIQWVMDHWGVLGCAMVTGLALMTLGGMRHAVSAEVPRQESTFYATALLMLSGLLGMILTADLFNLFVFMEISALCAYSLVATGGAGAPRAAFKYLILGTIGATLYLLGVGFLYAATGTLNMGDAASRIPGAEPDLVLFSLALIVTGLAIKMGVFPLHTWMPDAYSKTSTAAAALMAPIVTKVAGFAMIRILVHVYSVEVLAGGAPMLWLLCWAGAAATVVGALMAFLQDDLRRLLAYSSVSQMGLVAMGLGLANASGLTGGVLHLVNDALMKGTLFVAAGVALLRFGAITVQDLSRLRGRAPWTAAAIMIAGLSLIGIPPLCGFFGKWYVLLAAIEKQEWGLAAMIVLGSIVTAVYVFRILEYLYMKPASPLDEERREGLGLSVVACLVLALGVILFGLWSQRVVVHFVTPALGLG